MYKSVEVFEEPRSILEKMSESYVEMSFADHGFLCGLIKEFRPKKVVEVGVAGGGYYGCYYELPVYDGDDQCCYVFC